MSRSDQLRAELEVAELEDQLVAAKANPKVKADDLTELKNKVRAARQASRELREG